jgi:hypothetical protein
VCVYVCAVRVCVHISPNCHRVSKRNHFVVVFPSLEPEVHQVFMYWVVHGYGERCFVRAAHDVETVAMVDAISRPGRYYFEALKSIVLFVFALRVGTRKTKLF